MVAIWRRIKKGKQKVGGERDLEGAKMNRDENPAQDQPKWWRAGKDFKGEEDKEQITIQDRPKWWRAGKDF